MNKPLVLAAFALCAALSPLAGAETPPQPIKLTDAKRIEAFGRAIRAANLTTATTPPTAAHYTLTPVAPSNNGAQITIAGPGVFMLTNATGTFMLQPGATTGPSAVTMTIPTDPAKTYVMDCSVTYTAKVGFSLLKTTPVAPQHVVAEAGHAIWAFRAGSTPSTIRLETVGPQVVSFFGCDITRME
jgi:hypothetical protein